MERRFYDPLRPAVRALVDEIETRLGLQLEVRENPQAPLPARAVFSFANGRLTPHIECRESLAAATSKVYPEPGGIGLHELLHIRRFVVDRVPMAEFPTLPCEPGVSSSVPWLEPSSSDNHLEHLVIERQFPGFGFKPPDYAGLLAACRPMRSWDVHPVAGRWGYLAAALQAEFLTENIGARLRVERTLRKRGLLPAACELCKYILVCLQDQDPGRGKIGMVMVFAASVGIRLDYMRLIRPVADGVWDRVPLPETISIPTVDGVSMRLHRNETGMLELEMRKPNTAFNFTTKSGTSNYAAGLPALSKAYNASVDGIEQWSVALNWTPPANAPTYAGGKIVLRPASWPADPDVPLGYVGPKETSRTFGPFTMGSPQTYTPYFVSMDGSGRENTLVPGVTPAGAPFTVEAQTAGGLKANRLDPATLEGTEFEIVDGIFRMKGIDFSKGFNFNTDEFEIVDGAMRVKGVDFAKGFHGFSVGSAAVPKITVAPGGTPIGWIGADDAAGGSGYVGAWLKRLLIGGNSPANAPFFADSDGNVVAKTLLIHDAAAPLGWIGSKDGYQGAWFKRVLLGGSSPANAKIAFDASGNGFISGDLILGAVPSATAAGSVPATGVGAGTLPLGVLYAGAVYCSQLQAGTVSAAISMTAPTLLVTVPGGPVINIDPTNGVKATNGYYNATLNSGYFEARYSQNANARALLHPFQFDLQYDTGKYITMTAQNAGRTFNMTGNNGFLQVDIFAGDAPYINLVGGEYRVSGSAVINSSKQFVGAGVNCPSYGVACTAVNVNDGVQRYGRTVTLYDWDGNAMVFRGGVLCTS